MSNIGFVETTVLTNFLLKKDGSELAAEAAFACFATVQVPQFSWKEFKRGPLSNFIWFHNKLVTTNSYSQSILALQAMSRSPKRYLTATALQAVHTAFENIFANTSLGALSQQYGKGATMPEVMTRAYKLEMKHLIARAWDRRNTLHGGPVDKLACYTDAELGEKKGLIDARPRDCPSGSQCCLQQRLSNRKKEISKVRSAIDPNTTKKELIERRRVLKSLEKHSTWAMGPKECQRFGDAYFVLFCPSGGTVLTTNLSDIQPMAASLAKDVRQP